MTLARTTTWPLCTVSAANTEKRVSATSRPSTATLRSPPAHHNLGNIHFRRGEMAAAEQRFRQALQADSTYALAHLGLGNVQMLRKEYERAIASFRRGLRYQPDHPKLRRNLEAAEQIAAQVGR